jgi:hypothetical protein
LGRGAQARIGLALATTARARSRHCRRLDRGGPRSRRCLPPGIVDFFSAEPAPEPIRLDFAKMGARADLIMGPGHETHEAREVVKFPVDGKLRPLWLAPMENGGFCYRWHTFGSCGRMPHQGDAVKLGLGGQEGPYGQNWIVGHVTDPAIQRLELEYADGARIELRYVWVSSPIDAGFTAFQVLQERQREGRHAVAVIGFDANARKSSAARFPARPTRAGRPERTDCRASPIGARSERCSISAMSWESVGRSSWRRRLTRSFVTPTTVAAAAFHPSSRLSH